jgi:hypothetical protein
MVVEPSDIDTLDSSVVDVLSFFFFVFLEPPEKTPFIQAHCWPLIYYQ